MLRRTLVRSVILVINMAVATNYQSFKKAKFIWATWLNKVPNVEVSDTTGDDSSNAAKHKKQKAISEKPIAKRKGFEDHTNLEPQTSHN